MLHELEDIIKDFTLVTSEHVDIGILPSNADNLILEDDVDGKALILRTKWGTKGTYSTIQMIR